MSTTPRQLPTGTVSFFFSDVEGSTGLLQRLGGTYRSVIERHAEIVRGHFGEHGGIEVSTEGDSFFAVFTQTTDAVAAACDIQQSLAAETWPDGGVVAVRIGLHTGIGELGHDNYTGLDVNRAARISSAGHGGQVVVSEAVKVLATGFAFTDLGTHPLKGIDEPEHLYQVDVPGLPQTFPPLRTGSTRPNNLPTLAARLLGREVEQQKLIELITANRLVTLAGPGGIGKTRLALDIAKAVLARFPAGVWFVDLAPIDDPELLLPEIASTTGVDDTGDGGLAAALSDEPRLLLLDNFEQLVEGAPRLAELLSAAEPLQALVTSQVPLRVAAETVMRLDPLPANDEDAPAVALFVERARQTDPTFDLSDHRDDVMRLVEALDGVPLAIELAAARVNVLAPSQIFDRLGAGVLKGSRADSPERHRSIESAVAWSYDLLIAGQQHVLQALSVFRGGATLGALEAVVGRDPLDDLGELVDRSLVETETGTIGKRFDMLTSVQLYASSRIPEGSPYEARHADHFATLATDALVPLDSDAGPRWRFMLEDDVDNLRATLDHLLDDGDTERAFAMLGGSWRFFQISGRLDELELWLERCFGTAPDVAPTASRARALMARAAVHYWRSNWREAGADYHDALTIAETLDDQDLLKDALLGALTTRSNATAIGIDLGDPRELFERTRAMAVESGDLETMAMVEFHEIVITHGPAMKSAPPGPELFDNGVRLMRRAGRLMNVAHLRAAQAELVIVREDYEAALRYAADGLAAAEEAGDIFGMSWTLSRLATALFESGQRELAVRLAGAAEIARERSGGALPPPFVTFPDTLERARAVLGDTADDLYREGRGLGLLQAVGLARDAVAG